MWRRVIQSALMAIFIFGGTIPAQEFKGSARHDMNPPIAYTGPFSITLYQFGAEGGLWKDQWLHLRPLILRIVVTGEDFERMWDMQLRRAAHIQERDVEKWIGFSNLAAMEKKLAEPGPAGHATTAAYLKSIGVTGFCYNTEKSPTGRVYTPDAELDSLFDADEETNSVARFARMVRKYGFSKAIWVPYRQHADGRGVGPRRVENPDQAFKAMYRAGLDGIALQDQQYVTRTCSLELAAAFEATFEKHREAKGAPPFIVHNSVFNDTSGRSGARGGWALSDEYAGKKCGLMAESGEWRHADDFFDRAAEEIGAISIPDSPTEELIDFLKMLREKK